MDDDDLVIAAAILYSEDLIYEQEFLLLTKEAEKSAPIFPYWNYDRFALASMLDDRNAEANFGFIKTTFHVWQELFVCHQSCCICNMNCCCCACILAANAC